MGYCLGVSDGTAGLSPRSERMIRLAETYGKSDNLITNLYSDPRLSIFFE
jgi:hypothetical protein